jgi:hypothetical protein
MRFDWRVQSVQAVQMVQSVSESFDELRACTEFIEVTNGEKFDMIKKIPFMLRFSKHSVSFFSNLVVYYHRCGMPVTEV